MMRRLVPARLRGWLDDPNPILLKELRATLRRPRYARFLYLSTGILAVIVVLTGATMSVGDTPATVGKVLFHLFFALAVIIISLVAPAAAASTVVGEKEAKTFESLILTGMSARRIILGKMSAVMATFGLAMVAFTPVVGVAFLFGGVSPGQVLWAFVGVLLFLSLAVSFGVSISTRMPSARTAMAVTAVLFQPAAMMFGSTVWASAAVARPWGLSNDPGPFWWAEVLSGHFFKLEVFLFLFLIPVIQTAFVVSFFLLAAISGLKAPASDRSSPFKVWAFALVLWHAILSVVALDAAASDVQDMGFGLQFGVMMTSVFLGLLLANEPPLPPLAHDSEKQPGLLARALGPGAMGTLRTGLGLFVLMELAALIPSLAMTSWDEREFTTLLFLAAGNVVLPSFVLCFGLWLRQLVGAGIAVRGILFMTLVFLMVAGGFGGLIDSVAEHQGEASFLFSITPFGHAIPLFASRGTPLPVAHGVVNLLFYGVLTLIFGVLVIRKTAAAAVRERARREGLSRRLAERQRWEQENQVDGVGVQRAAELGAASQGTAGGGAVSPGRPESSAESAARSFAGAPAVAPTEADDAGALRDLASSDSAFSGLALGESKPNESEFSTSKSDETTDSTVSATESETPSSSEPPAAS